MTENKKRIPTQGRARATYEAILEASFQILDREGEKKLTTNLIAERAGVSIGTLYQYFTDRDDILSELGHREAEAMRERIAQIITASPDRANVRAVVRALMDGGKGSAATRAILSETLFRRRGESVLSTQHLSFMQSISDLPGERLTPNAEQGFILTHAAICLLRAAAAEPELQLNRNRLEDELVRLMESYLTALGRA